MIRHTGSRKGFETGKDELQREELAAFQASERKPRSRFLKDAALHGMVAFAMSMAECRQSKVQKHT
jgi:hypothetical protein